MKIEELELNPYPDFDNVRERADALEALAINVAQDAINVLQEQQPDVDWPEIFTLLRDEHRIVEEHGVDGFQAKFKTENGDIDAVKTAAYERLALVKNTVRSYAPVLIERGYNKDTGATFNLIRQNVFEMQALGFSYKDAVKFFDQDAKISKSPTPHPTEGLSINGIKLACALVGSAESDPEDRDAAITDAVRDIVVSEDFGAKRKFTVMDEAELSDFYAMNHNAGVSTLERFIEDSIEEAYGARPDITLDAALRSWDYDSDGKNNAEGFAFMAKMSRTTLGAFNQIIEAIESIDVELPKELAEFYDDCVKVRTSLQAIYDRSAEITKTLATTADSKEREAYYREAYGEYEGLKTQLMSVYEGVGSHNRGFDFYKDALTTMKASIEALGGSNSDDAIQLDDALRLIRRNGFALEKGQPRQNDFMHIKLISNLFLSESFRARGIFRKEELDEVDGVGGYQGLDEVRQRHFLRIAASHVREQGCAKDILADLYAANPLEFAENGNGYPLQTRTLIDRLNLEHLYQLKFDQNIISDAQAGSDERMHFLFQLTGMGNGTSMSLHEDRGTLPRRMRLLEIFARGAGGRALSQVRGFYEKLKGTPLDKTSGKDTAVSIIHPASDAERGGGFGTRMETMSGAVRGIATLSYDSGITVPQMLGGGMSTGRSGVNPMIVINTIAEELKSIVQERRYGRFDRRLKEDRDIMRSATTMSFTEQGRQKRYNMATPMQVASDFSRKLSRMISIRFDLEGLVEDHTFIDKKSAFRNENVALFMEGLWKKSIDRFSTMRFAKTKNGAIILDILADEITTPYTIGLKNNSARAASKDGNAKQMTGVRAIQNDMRFNISELFAGGFLSGGQMMVDLANAVNDEGSDIALGDVSDWISNREWDFSVHTKCLIDAGRFDPTYALQQLNWGDASFDELKAVGEEVRFVNVEGEDRIAMAYSGDRRDLSDSQLYFAKIWYDRLLYVSHMEAALSDADSDVTLKSAHKDIVGAFRPQDNTPTFGLGPKAMGKYSRVVTVLEEQTRNRPQHAISQMREAQIKRDVEERGLSKAEAFERQGGESALRMSGSTYRAGTIPHWPFWASEFRYGTKPRPPEFVIENVMTQKARGDLPRMSASQNSQAYALH